MFKNVPHVKKKKKKKRKRKRKKKNVARMQVKHLLNVNSLDII